MKEQLITFDTAKLAKEKGFTGIFKEFDLVQMYLMLEDGTGELYDELQGNEHLGDYLAPTQSLLQKWLRDKHNIHIVIWYNVLSEKYRLDFINNTDPCIDFEGSYENVLEVGLQEALKLIEIW